LRGGCSTQEQSLKTSLQLGRLTSWSQTWSWGCVSAIDREGRTIWIIDAHHDFGKRFVLRVDEKLTAFVKLETAIRDWAILLRVTVSEWLA